MKRGAHKHQQHRAPNTKRANRGPPALSSAITTSSLARATDDPVLKERYVDLAVDLVRNAERESPGDKMSDAGSVERSPQKK